MASYRQCLRQAKEILTKAHIADADADAWYLMEFVTGMDRTHYLLGSGDEMPVSREDAYRELIKKREQHIPLQHLTGIQEFMGLPFSVNENVLIPRQDTELLVSLVLEHALNGMQVLDLCTGSGCIAVSLARLGPSLEVTASDLSRKALETAKNNGASLQAEVTWLQGDLFAPLLPDSRFDIIVSNPPYIPSGVIDSLDEEVRCHEPRIALDGEEDGLAFYRRIIREAPEYLKPGGWLFLEIGADQGMEVSAMMQNYLFEDVRTRKDLAGLDRVVYGRKKRLA